MSTDRQPLARSPRRRARKVLRVTIPSYATLTEEERDAVDVGGPWPVRIEEVEDADRLLAGPRPVHLALIDFLIEEACKCSTD